MSSKALQLYIPSTNKLSARKKQPNNRPIRKPYQKPKTKKAIRQRKSQSRTVTITRRKGQNEGQNDDLKQTSIVLGRKPRYTFNLIRNIVKANESRLVYGLRAMSRFGGTAGQKTLLNSQTAAGSELYAPLYLIDVTSAPNDVQGSITLPSTMYYTSFSNEVDTASYVKFTASGTATDHLGLENAPQGGSTIITNYPMGSSMLRWVQAKMMFYCPTQEPTKINVALVSFRDDRLPPAVVSQGSADSKTDAFSISFYQSLLKKYMYNPIDVSDPTVDKYLKYHYSHTFVLNPKESTESVDTRYREIDIFKWLNKKCVYNWSDEDKMSLVSATDFQKNISQNKTSVAPRQRLFLMIRALSGYVSNSIAHDTTKQPSFDIVVRTCHSQFV